MLVAAALAMGLGVLSQHHGGFARIRAAARRATPIANETDALTARVLHWLAPDDPVIQLPPAPAMDVVDEVAMQAALDQRVPGRRRMNVVWIAMDTVRFDHTGFTPIPDGAGGTHLYDRRPTTPRLDAFARDAFVFGEAYTAYPTSNYAYSALFSGLSPRATPLHAIRTNRDWNLPAETTIAGLLSTRGFATVGLTAFNRETTSDPKYFGSLSRGFEVYNPEPSNENLTSAQLTEQVTQRLGELGDRPFFLFAHYLDPHEPYPDRHDQIIFGNGAIDGYDSDIRQTDHEVGRVLDRLRELGLEDDTLVAIFSDHGEAFGEHGSTRHASSLYEEQSHVPLVIRVPGMKGRVVTGPANLIDLVPTTLSFLGIEDPLGTDGRHGRNLLPQMLSEKPGEAVLFQRALPEPGFRP